LQTQSLRHETHRCGGIRASITMILRIMLLTDTVVCSHIVVIIEQSCIVMIVVACATHVVVVVVVNHLRILAFAAGVNTIDYDSLEAPSFGS
jgi:hypothetical protein